MTETMNKYESTEIFLLWLMCITMLVGAHYLVTLWEWTTAEINSLYVSAVPVIALGIIVVLTAYQGYKEFVVNEDEDGS